MDISKGVDGRVDQSDDEQRQGRRDGKQDPFLARFGMGDGHGEDDCEGQDRDEGSDEESEADFRQGLRFVTTGLTVIIARVDTADNAEDDAHGVEDFGELYMSCSDERLVGLVDVGLDPTEQAARKLPVSTFRLKGKFLLRMGTNSGRYGESGL